MSTICYNILFETGPWFESWVSFNESKPSESIGYLSFNLTLRKIWLKRN